MKLQVFTWMVVLSAVCAFAPARAQTPLTEANHAIQQPELTSKPEPLPHKKIQIESGAAISPSVPEAAGDSFFIGAISVEGGHEIAASDFSPVIERFMGRKLTTEDLRRLCQEIADVARARGYSFASAYVPPQELSLGVLRVILDEGVVSAIRVNGSTNKQLIATLNRLRGHASTAAVTEKQILLAADVPGIALQRIKFMRENGLGVLVVDVTERRMRAVISVDNNGTSELGPVRLNLSVDLDSLLVGGDVLSVAAVSTPVHVKELAFVALKYALPIDADGTVLSIAAAYGHTQPGGFLAPFNALGRSYDLSVSINHPLIRNRKNSLWVSGGFDYLVSSQDIVGIRLNDDKLATAWLSLNGNTEVLKGRLRGELTLTQGLPVLGTTRLGDPLASRGDGSGLFTKATFAADWSGTLEGALSLRVAARGQIASGPLLSAQQLTFGGVSFGRAYDISTISGDEGALGLIELRGEFNQPTKWLDWAQPYVFVDGGTLSYLGGDPGNGPLFSAGGGVRTRVRKTYVNFETAVPLTTNPTTGDTHKPRFNFQVTEAF